MCVRAMLVLHYPLQGLCADVCQGDVSIASPLWGSCADVCRGDVSITSPFAGILFVCVEVLQPSQQLRSCKPSQLPITLFLGRLRPTKRLTST